MTPPRHVLVYRCGTLGDTLVALPAMRAVRGAFPDARLTLMTANDGGGVPWTDDVLRDVDLFDAVLTYRRTMLQSARGVLALAARVRRARPDLVVHLGSDRNGALRVWRDRAFFLLAGVRRFVAAATPGKVTALGRLRRDVGPQPFEVQRLLAALTARGIGDGRVRFDLPDRVEDTARADAVLGEAGRDRRPLVALCPGSKQPSKRWPTERWTAIAGRLVAECGATVVVVGGADEAAIGRTMARALPAGRVLVAAGRTTVLESAALLRRCALYVGNDTGAMHLAAAVGTRCVAVFAAREPARSWHPWGEGHVVLRRDDVPCAPCYRAECTTAGLVCLTAIGVDEVWAACDAALADAAPAEEIRRCAG